MVKLKDLDEEVERQLWQAWKGQGQQQARQQLIDAYTPFAHMLAAKLYAGRQIAQSEFQDYRQYAIIGMIEAVDRYDASRGASFKTYAGHRINGAILNGMEKSCEKQQQITARAYLRQQRLESMREGRKPAPGKDLFAELADLAIGLALGYMLEDSTMYQSQEPHQIENFYDRHELNELKKMMRRIVDVLPEQARSVIRHHYFQGMSFEEIARTMDLSKGRISQIHRQALNLLQKVYAGGEGVNVSL
ncbi:MAG: sigma-70 family RNA polymerase sigma factor [Pseudomonadota bacterium]